MAIQKLWIMQIFEILSEKIFLSLWSFLTFLKYAPDVHFVEFHKSDKIEAKEYEEKRETVRKCNGALP